jgi:alkylated DNA repair dioxygenase AlkB
VPQIALFASTERVLADDPRGRIAYTPGFVDERTADAWFRVLRDTVNWQAQRRRMYERDVDVPRLTAHYDLDDDGASPPSAIREAVDRVHGATSVSFNSVGLNYYRDGRDSVAPHNDHLDELVEGFPIVLVSLGSSRRMTIRAKEPPRRAFHLDLEPGSLLSMSYATQLHYTHGIPKTTEEVGPRISLAFRVRPPGSSGRRRRRGFYSSAAGASGVRGATRAIASSTPTTAANAAACETTLPPAGRPSAA